MGRVPRALNVVTLILLCATCSAKAAPDVQLPSGIARGKASDFAPSQNIIIPRGSDKQASDTLRIYSAYYGISFAEPPVGELRFLPPRPFRGGDPRAVITSDRFRSACYQDGLPEQAMSEDCLHLNVFSPPDVDFGPFRKVMVWIHGGGFFQGEASLYVPSRLVTDNDVIVVTIQYRLGALGFLSSGDKALSGNLGLRDQVLALQWVKDNIGRFGGDAEDVTIFGESAGAASVAALSLTPATKGLFTKAIMQSGTILSPWALDSNPLKEFYQHAEKTGCFPRFYNPWNKRGYHESIVACLKRKSPREILDVQQDLEYSSPLTQSIAELPLLAPVVDGDFFPRAPASLLSDRAYLQEIGALNRSYILGVNDNEGIVMASVVPKEDYDFYTRPSNVASLIKSTVRAYLNRSPDTDVLNVVDFLYSFPREANGLVPLQSLFDLSSDESYVIPTTRFARAMVAASPSTSVYLYLFDAEPKLRDPNGPLQGTSHGMDFYHEFDIAPNALDDLIFFYADLDPVKFPILAEAFRGFVTSFAKTGTPTVNGVNSWPRFDLTRESYVALSTSPEVRERMFAQRVALWTDFIPRLTASDWLAIGKGWAAYRG